MNRTSKLIAIASGAMLLTGCPSATLDNSAGRRTVYQDVASISPTTAGVGVESQDVVSMTDRMMRDILATPAVAGRATAPRIALDSADFRNDSSSRINKNVITDRLRIELSRAAQGRIVFVSSEHNAMIEREREAKRSGKTDAGTIRATKATAGVDYRLVGRINSLDAASRSSGAVSRYHQITFELIDMELGTVVWANMYEFKKEAQDDILYR
jgi:PBP1b-binding outer membrane lipoprotein LpoB